MSVNIQVFSPHFDDASLSCGEHILAWAKKGMKVEVITVFTRFGAEHLSKDSIEFMKKGHVESVTEFEKVRGQEDRESMGKLGVASYKWLNLVDAGFREQDSTPTYQTHQELFAGTIKDSASWQSQLELRLQQEVKTEAVVVCPLGVGQHADHLLVRRILEKYVPTERLLYYVDIPYALQLSNWRWPQFWQVVTSPTSLSWSSPDKIEAVTVYNSQVPLLFQNGIWQYPECVAGRAFKNNVELRLS
ncbi:PIG-L family deacetylase [Patescibacteria group bacterium]|nr:PIG-L family deacetylase [Patescibacteria group bacterium]